MPTSKIRIIIVDNHTILRAGLKLLINAEADMEVVGEATNGRQAVQKVSEVKPDVAIMDITMPGTNGIEAIEQVLKASRSTRVLVLTMHEDLTYVRSTLAAGAMGYIIKEAADTDLLSAIRTVHQGRMFVDKSLSTILINDLIRKPPRNSRQASTSKNFLSPREHDVLVLLARGFTNKEIADKIHVSIKSVESYRQRLGLKLGLHTRADFTRYAFGAGLLTPENFND